MGWFKTKSESEKLLLIKKDIAKRFNDVYTYNERYDTSSNDIIRGTFYGGAILKGNAWMCPDCNKIHLAYECSVFDGLHYPECCFTYKGHRLLFNIKINSKG